MKKVIMPLVICLVVLVGSIGVLQWRAQNADERMLDAIETSAALSEPADAKTETEAETLSASQPKDEAGATTEAASPAPDMASITEDGALVLGKADAPVTIVEYASLSCSHCADFHKNTLPLVKKDYVDDGSVKIILRDFPLNQQAMDGSKLLRCVDVKDRYSFMNLLFEQQDQWAYDAGNYRDKLKQYAALLGISNDKAESCMNDKATETLIVQQIQKANSSYQIDSTPTFIVQPGDKVMKGSLPYASFSSTIEDMLKAKE